MIYKPTLKERYKHWRIGRRLKQLDRKFFALDITNIPEITRIRQESEPLQNEYDLFETRQLQWLAERYCIEISEDQRDWWNIVTAAELTGIQSFDMSVSLLNETGQRHVRKLIREERFRLLEKWVAVLVPILSLVIAILALTQNRC